MTNDNTADIKGFIEFLEKQRLDDGKTKVLNDSITPNMLYRYYYVYSKGKTIWVFEKSISKILISFGIFHKMQGALKFSQTHYNDFLKLMEGAGK